jgi:hypothetical protein
MNTTQKQAAAHAARIEWDTDKAFAYCVALLTECNLHSEAKALQQAFALKAEIEREMWAKLQEQAA